MNCTWAEGQLSFYLDDALDPQTRSQVQDHLDACLRCREVLEEYRQFDRLLHDLPPQQPPESLRARIFESEEFAALLRGQEDERPQSPRARGISPIWTRALLPSAAVVTLALGGAFVAKQYELLPAASTTGPGGTATLGGPSGSAPLSAGPRVVYAHGGRLWSAPEQGTGVGQPLTPSHVRVAAWSVAPANGDDGARQVVYLDAATGAIHLIRSDDQSDHVIGHMTLAGLPADFWQSATGKAVQAGFVWSPDGSRIAYLAPNASGGATLRLMNADGTHNVPLTGDTQAIVSPAVWSDDSLHLAFTQTSGGDESVWTYDVVANATTQLAAHADPTQPSATIARLSWLADTISPTVTWAAESGGTITGIFAQHVLGNSQAQRLTASGATFAAADFSPAAHGGSWIVAQGSHLQLLVASSGTSATATDMQAAISQIAWSPDGSTAAIVAGGTLSIWHPGTGFTPVAGNVSATIRPVWSADGHELAYVTGTSVMSAQMQNGIVAAVVVLLHDTSPQALGWAPDGHALVVASARGVSLVTSDGAGSRVVDSAPAEDGALAWSVAG